VSSLDELENVLRPPPSGGPTADWASVEAGVRTALPSDYKRYVDAYGFGRIDRFLWVFHPTTANRHFRLGDEISGQLDALRQVRDEGERIPYPLFPEDGGILPWGRTDNGDVCYWLRRGSDPDRWIVAVNESRGPDWDEFEGSMTEFLVAVLARRYTCFVFPDSFPSDDPAFEPRDG
jgi:hypothetical protein